MADGKTGFFSGLFNPDRAVSVEGTVSGIDSLVAKLGNIDSAAAAEHIEILNKHNTRLADHQLKLENAVNSGGDVNAAKAALREANKEAASAIKSGKSHIRGVNSYARGQMISRIMTSKPAMIIGGAAVAVGALSWLSSKRDSQVRESQEALRAKNMEAMQSDIMTMHQQQAASPMVGANTMMGLEPVHGDHAQRILAARSGSVGIDTSAPNMSAANYEVARS